MTPNSHMRGSDLMVEFAPGCFVAEPAGVRLGIVKPLEQDRSRFARFAPEVPIAIKPDVDPCPPLLTSYERAAGPTEAQRKTIRLLKKLGNSPREIAAETGFTIAMVKTVLAG